MHDNEALYIQFVEPIIDQLIKACDEHGLEMMVAVFVPTKEQPDLNYRAGTPDREGKMCPEHAAIAQACVADPTSEDMLIPRTKQ